MCDVVAEAEKVVQVCVHVDSRWKFDGVKDARPKPRSAIKRCKLLRGADAKIAHAGVRTRTIHCIEETCGLFGTVNEELEREFGSVKSGRKEMGEQRLCVGRHVDYRILSCPATLTDAIAAVGARCPLSVIIMRSRWLSNLKGLYFVCVFGDVMNARSKRAQREHQL